MEDFESKPKKKLTPLQAKSAIERYCAYQERSQSEVRTRLYSYGLYGDVIEEIISTLIINKFLNEERYAKALAGGKFRVKKWGKVKIIQKIKQSGLSVYCIKSGMKEIPEEDYKAELEKQFHKKLPNIKESNKAILKQKIARFLIGKGYEGNLVWDLIARELK